MKQDMSYNTALVMHEAGYRFIDQRQRILSVLRDSQDHMTAEEIYAELRRLGKRVSIGTIYRAVEVLEKIGLVRKINLGDRNRYELLDSHSDTAHHYHLVCERCGRIIDISEDFLAEYADSFKEFAKEVSSASGFRVSGYQFRIFGICSNCQ